ncbi:MAG: J domain-containing protein [Prochlorococcaceae cyanobacterium]
MSRFTSTAAAVDPYRVLGVTPQASGEEIKAAYRSLVKQHHPDAGGDDTTILALNAAWEVLGDHDRRQHYDRHQAARGRSPDAGASDTAAATASAAPSAASGQPAAGVAAAAAEERALWLRQVYGPIDRLLGEVVNPFPAQLRALAADPYDDAVMEAFCTFLEQGQARLKRVETLYRSQPCPAGLQAFSLDLYHCLSLVKDALLDLERFTMGYVDSYLRDGRELLRQARQRRRELQESRRQLRR